MQHTIEIEAPVARVWALTVDLAGLPDVTPTITEVEVLDRGEVRPGTRARLSQPGLPTGVWIVEEVVPERRFVWSRTMPGLRMVASHLLEPVGDDRCRQTLSIEVDGGFASLARRVMRRPVEEALARENAGFAAAAEDGGPVPATDG